MAGNNDQGTRLVRDLVYGMVGGVIGTIAISYVGNWLYKYESEEKRKLEEKLRPEDPYISMARLVERKFGLALSEEARVTLGEALHWGYGMLWGALYGVVRNRLPALSKASGVPFGVAFFLIGDEALNTVLKLTPPPQAFPIDAHLRGLIGHLAFTAATDGTYKVLSRIGG